MQILNPEEHTYLRLLVFGFTEEQINSYMNFSEKQGKLTQSSLELKFGTEDWRELTKMAFQNGLLNKQDYVPDAIKVTSNNTIKSIYNYLKASEMGSVGPKVAIKQALVGYLAKSISVESWE